MENHGGIICLSDGDDNVVVEGLHNVFVTANDGVANDGVANDGVANDGVANDGVANDVPEPEAGGSSTGSTRNLCSLVENDGGVHGGDLGAHLNATPFEEDNVWGARDKGVKYNVYLQLNIYRFEE